MKIKLDENLPQALAAILSTLGHDVDTVLQEGLQGRQDPVIWESVQREARFFITQDLDFSDRRQFAPGTHHGILVLRLREPGRKALLQKLRMVFETEAVHEWAGCFIVVTDHKIRVRRTA